LQIERLGLWAMVSLTDHDNIDAGLILQSGELAGEAPISVEWTVPFEQTYFHLGVHNLAPTQATTLMHAMAEQTRDPQSCNLGHLLEALQADPGVLIVLNHPLWDMAGIGSSIVLGLAKKFLATYGAFIHALEMNGLRSWQENRDAIGMANELSYPVVAGGDRHGLEPNALLNLTRASTFAEFVEEIRVDRSSDILTQPQYKEPLPLRHLLTAWDAAREHPQYAEKQRWVARVFVMCGDGIERPLSAVWINGAPSWIDPCLNVIGLISSSPVRTAARLAFQAAGSATP
jgi:hypothetical protein